VRSRKAPTCTKGLRRKRYAPELKVKNVFRRNTKVEIKIDICTNGKWERPYQLISLQTLVPGSVYKSLVQYSTSFYRPLFYVDQLRPRADA
jgi:hypothetical protein